MWINVTDRSLLNSGFEERVNAEVFAAIRKRAEAAVGVSADVLASDETKNTASEVAAVREGE